MENNVISREVHDEFARRMEEANARQDARLSELEKSVAQIHTLTASVQKLAVSMETMTKELAQQGKRLETIENRDGEMWRKVVATIVTGFVGALVGFVATKLSGM